MKIAFDIDGVVLKSIEIILDHINKVTGRCLVPDDLFCWDLEPLGLDLGTLRDAVNYMYSQKMIEPYAGALKALSADPPHHRRASAVHHGPCNAGDRSTTARGAAVEPDCAENDRDGGKQGQTSLSEPGTGRFHSGG